MLKNILLGVGITLVIISLILILTDTPLLSENDNLSRDELVEQAKEIGMTFPGQNYAQNNPAELSLERKTRLSLPRAEVDNSSSAKSSPITIQIPTGVSSHKVADLLLEKNLIKDQKSFLKLLTKYNLENKMRAGQYEVESDISPLKLLLILTGE